MTDNKHYTNLYYMIRGLEEELPLYKMVFDEMKQELIKMKNVYENKSDIIEVE